MFSLYFLASYNGENIAHFIKVKKLISLDWTRPFSHYNNNRILYCNVINTKKQFSIRRCTVVFRETLHKRSVPVNFPRLNHC